MRLTTFIDQRSLNKTLKKLADVPGSVGRKALRKGVFKAGSDTLKAAKSAAPKGRTGAFRRSLARKDIRRADRGYYASLVGQNVRRVATDKQIASAKKKSGRLSGGLSGAGLYPPIHLVESRVRRHKIRSSGKPLAWNRGRGGALLPGIRRAQVVKHPGHRGTGFLNKVERAGRSQRLRTIKNEIEAELRKLRG